MLGKCLKQAGDHGYAKNAAMWLWRGINKFEEGGKRKRQFCMTFQQRRKSWAMLHFTLNCLKRVCQQCGVKCLRNYLKPFVNKGSDGVVSWHQWESVERTQSLTLYLLCTQRSRHWNIHYMFREEYATISRAHLPGLWQ